MSTEAPQARRPVTDPDRTARARIRDAAFARFAEHGVAGTSLKAIAEDAVVSPPLVIHHFGSKDGLRRACDEYVAAAIRDGKRAAMAAGGSLDPLEAMRQVETGPPLLKYLARTLGEGSGHVAALIDELVEDAVAYMAEGVDNGVLTPSDFPRQRAVVLVMWSLGALVLHEHVERLLGVDLAGDSAEGLLGWVLPAAEILAKGVLDEAVYEQWRELAPVEDPEHDPHRGAGP